MVPPKPAPWSESVAEMEAFAAFMAATLAAPKWSRQRTMVRCKSGKPTARMGRKMPLQGLNKASKATPYHEGGEAAVSGVTIP